MLCITFDGACRRDGGRKQVQLCGVFPIPALDLWRRATDVLGFPRLKSIVSGEHEAPAAGELIPSRAVQA